MPPGSDRCVAGVDVGSTLTKVVVRNGDVLASATDRTQVDYVGAAARLLAETLGRAGRAPGDLAYVVARAGFEFLRHGRPKGKGAGQAILVAAMVAIVSYLVYVVTQLLVLYLSRTREYYADAYSGAATRDPHQLASALTKVAYGLSLARRTDEPSGLRAFMIGDPVRAAADYATLQEKMERYDLDKDGQLDVYELEKAFDAEYSSHWRRANALLSTHPSTYARILMLELLEEEIKSGGLPANVYEFI